MPNSDSRDGRVLLLGGVRCIVEQSHDRSLIKDFGSQWWMVRPVEDYGHVLGTDYSRSAAITHAERCIEAKRDATGGAYEAPKISVDR